MGTGAIQKKTVQFGARNVLVYTQSSHGGNGEVASKQRKEKQLALETNPTYHPKRPFAYSFRNHFFMVSFATAFSKLSRLRFYLSRGLCQDNCIILQKLFMEVFDVAHLQVIW